MTCNHEPSEPKALLSLCTHCGEIITYDGRQLRDDELKILISPEWGALRREWERRQKSAT